MPTIGLRTEAHRLVADLESSLIEQLLFVPERQREANENPDCQPDHLRAHAEVAQGAVPGHASRAVGLSVLLKLRNLNSASAALSGSWAGFCLQPKTELASKCLDAKVGAGQHRQAQIASQPGLKMRQRGLRQHNYFAVLRQCLGGD